MRRNLAKQIIALPEVPRLLDESRPGWREARYGEDFDLKRPWWVELDLQGLLAEAKLPYATGRQPRTVYRHTSHDDN